MAATAVRVSFAQESIPFPDRQVITANEIRFAGLQRPSDLLRLFDGWVYVSRDGWHVDAAAGGSFAGEKDLWEVWLDGHRITTSVLGSQDLNTLPFALDDIEYVEVFRTPRLIGGVFAGHGLLHFHTLRADPGSVQVQGSTWLGNESGDPGPFRFLDENTPNVDHIGPDNTASASWASNSVRLRGSVVKRTHYPTDASIRRRHLDISSEYPEIELLGGEMAFGTDSHGMLLQVSSIDGFYFLRPFGRELPTHTSRLFAGGRGELLRDARLGYRASIIRTSLNERPNTGGFVFRWQVDRLEGSADLKIGPDALNAAAGVSAEWLRVQAMHSLEDPGLGRAGVHARLSPAAGRRFRPTLELQANTDGERLYASGVLSASGRIGTRHTYFASFASVRAHAADEHPLWFWARRGFSILETVGVDHTFPRDLAGSRTSSLDVRWRTQIGRWGASFGLYGRWFEGVWLEDRAFAYDPEAEAFSGPARVIGPFAGRTAGSTITLEGRLHESVRQRSFVRIEPVRSGSDRLEEAMERRPETQARSMWYVAAHPNLSIGAGIAYRSATWWPDYDVRDAIERYSARVPPSWTIDMAATKYFWDRRVGVTIDIQNLLNRPYRHHPIGGSYDLRLFVRLFVRFAG